VLLDQTAQLTTPALSLRGVTKAFPGTLALDDVDLDVAAGEIHALVGHNGSGKSTLVKVLAGYHVPEAGTAAVDGTPMHLDHGDRRASGLRFVHQTTGLVEALSVADNFRLCSSRARLRRLHRGDERRAADHAMRALGYVIDPSTPVGALAAAERTAVALARALEGWEDHVRLVVLDEVTASLAGPEVERLLSALRAVRDRGVAVLFVSHHLDEVLDVADMVTVLRDGRRVATVPPAELTHEGLVELMLGRTLDAAPPRPGSVTGDDPARVQVCGLGGRVLSSLDVQVRAGEVLGIAGLTGSGREEVAGLISGRLPRLGTVTVDGYDVAAGDARAAVAAGVCCVPSDRAAQALLVQGTVRQNLTLPDLSAFWRRGWLRQRSERAESARWCGDLQIRPGRTEEPVAGLSGGNQQKVVLARWLRLRPRVLVLDEPTQGVDVGSKADIHLLVDKAAAEGAAVIVCSTDAEELARVATEVVVLHRGCEAVRLTGDDLTVANIEREQLLAHVPSATRDRRPS
jgi:ribose transport system ATP-binding protein